MSGAGELPAVGRGLPAWLLRVAVAVIGMVVIAIPSAEGAATGALVILGPTVLASAYAPASQMPSFVVAVAALLVALTGEDPLRPAVLAMIPAVHLFHVVCGIAGVLPARGRLHPRALARPAVRFLLVQAVVFAMVGLAALVPVRRTPVLLEVLALVGLVAIALVILLAQRGRGDRSHTSGHRRADQDGASMEAWGEGEPTRPGS